MTTEQNIAVLRRWLQFANAGFNGNFGVRTEATHLDDFNGIAATGRRVQFSGIVIYRFADGKIAESWGELDFAGLWRQLTAS